MYQHLPVLLPELLLFLVQAAVFWAVIVIPPVFVLVLAANTWLEIGSSSSSEAGKHVLSIHDDTVILRRFMFNVQRCLLARSLFHKQLLTCADNSTQQNRPAGRLPIPLQQCLWHLCDWTSQRERCHQKQTRAHHFATVCGPQKMRFVVALTSGWLHCLLTVVLLQPQVPPPVHMQPTATASTSPTGGHCCCRPL